ncbi:MAG: hypothetical protein PHN80_04240 [Hespellia sp.]|nr:hypothetical protein [Hespellia sp.]
MRVQNKQAESSATDRNYENLANAIILTAVKDYRGALQRLKRNPHSEGAKSSKNEVERFFHSGLFSVLTSVDADMLIRKLNAEVDE